MGGVLNQHEINELLAGLDADQQIKADAGKLQLSLVPSQIIKDIAEVRMYGNKKYGDSESWKKVEMRRYIDALYRHFLAFVDDPKSVDEESGIPHYKHMACNMAFISHMMYEDEMKIVNFAKELASVPMGVSVVNGEPIVAPVDSPNGVV